MRASWTPAWAAANGAWAASAVASACRWSSSASREIALRECDRAEPGESEGRVLTEPDAPRELERAPVALDRRCAVLPALRDPRLEQQPGNAKRVVPDRVRMAMDRRRHRGDRSNVAVTRRRRRPDDAARRDAPVISRRLERGRRVSRHRVSAFADAGLRKREGERQLREPQLPGSRGRRGERERALARRQRGVEIELLGRQIAEAREQLDPQLHRCVIARRRQREIEEAPSLGNAPGQAEVPRQRSEPNRDARVRRVPRVRERGPEIVVLERQPALAAQPIRPAQVRPRVVGEGREVVGVGGASGGEPAALGKTLEHVVAHRVEHVVTGDAARERRRHDRLVDKRSNEVRDGRLAEAVASRRPRRARPTTRRPGGRQACWSSVFSSPCRRS